MTGVHGLRKIEKSKTEYSLKFNIRNHNKLIFAIDKNLEVWFHLNIFLRRVLTCLFETLELLRTCDGFFL